MKKKYKASIDFYYHADDMNEARKRADEIAIEMEKSSMFKIKAENMGREFIGEEDY